MRHLRFVIAFLGLFIIAGSMGWSIFEKENILTNGQTILLPVGPRDPRSLMQGDYMRLAYDPTLFPSMEVVKDLPYKGFSILKLGDKQQASFARIDDGSTLSENEIRIVYRRSRTGWRLSGIKYAADSYFFEEGQGKRFNNARFIMVVVGEGGDTILTGLADADGNRIADTAPEITVQ